MAKLDIDKYVRKLNGKLRELEKGKPVYIAAKTVQENMSLRIFEQGKSVTGKVFNYSSTSYKAKRRKKGRQTSFVNFVFTGELQSDFNNGSNPEPTKINNLTYAIDLRKNNMDKVKGLESKKLFNSKIFSASVKDRKLFKEIISKEIRLILLR